METFTIGECIVEYRHNSAKINGKSIRQANQTGLLPNVIDADRLFWNRDIGIWCRGEKYESEGFELWTHLPPEEAKTELCKRI